MQMNSTNIVLIQMGFRKVISQHLLDRWIRFVKQEKSLSYIVDPRAYLLQHTIDPRNFCINNDLIDKWNDFN